jgi:hypothetical protein
MTPPSLGAQSIGVTLLRIEVVVDPGEGEDARAAATALLALRRARIF